MTNIFSSFLVLSVVILNCFSAVTNNVLSQADKDALLDMHNDARQKTADGLMPCNNYGGFCPSGTITALEWDDTVALSAQNQANTLQTNCQFAHIGGHSYGENLAAHSSTSANYVSVCDGWIEPEALEYCYGEDTTGNGGQNVFSAIGHFTQVVSERTTQLGCGCADNTDCQWSRLCVCQYNSPGNYNGDTVPGGIKFPYATTQSYSCGNTPDPTASPVPAPTPAPVTGSNTEEPDNSDNDPGSLSCTTITISGIDWSSFNGDYTCSSDTGSNIYSGNGLYLFYNNYRQGWALSETVGGAHYGWCVCPSSNCAVTSCNTWTDWTIGWDESQAYAITISSGSAYSSSSSSSNDKNELIEGLLIGLGIAIGVFVLSLLIYWCVKRRNSKQNQYNIVEMNNEISNHEYVGMQN